MSAHATPALVPPPALEEPVAGNYFVAVYPPFSVWRPSEVPALQTALQEPGPAAPIGLYVHLPFCQKKCDYCYYLSYVGQKPDVVDRYLDHLVRELTLYSRRPGVAGRPVSFVYFGGGTPSTLTVPQLQRLMTGLRAVLPWTGVEEVTFECAPRSVRPDFLQALGELGVTRISMGLQSFDNTVLKLNGRIHLAEDAVRAFTQIRQAGFGHVNLDLMTGLVGETWTRWEKSVRRVAELGPESVTIYQTEIPHNTRLYRDVQANGLSLSLVPWPEKRQRLAYAFSELEQAGYTVVNGYSALKDPARHRFRYQDNLWRGADMLGLGVASFGYCAGVHYQNAVTLETYQAAIEDGALPLQRAFRLSARDRLVREFVLQLKCGKVSAAAFKEKFDEDILQLFAEPLADLAAGGMLTSTEAGVQLTNAGLVSVDRLLPRFYDPEYRNVRYT